MNTIIGIVIALIVAGFVFWAVRRLIALVPMEPWIKSVVDTLLVILVVAVILFWVIIPLISMLGHVHIPGLR